MVIAFLPNPIYILPCVQNNLESNLEASIETLISSYPDTKQNLSYITIDNTMIIFDSTYNIEQKLNDIYNIDKLKNMKAFW